MYIVYTSYESLQALIFNEYQDEYFVKKFEFTQATLYKTLDVILNGVNSNEINE